jgi:hypothetical protein
MDKFKEKKPHIAGELGGWLNTLQHSLRTPSIECKYYIQVEVKHAGIGKDLPKFTVPIQIYYHNNIFEDSKNNGHFV